MKNAQTVFLIVLIAAGALFSRVYSPRVVSEDVADLSGDWQNFLQYKNFTGKSGQALCIAIHQYLTDTLTGFIHYCAADDIEPGKTSYPQAYEYQHVRDPIKNLNTRGHGFCGIMSSINSGIYHETGFTSTRLAAGPAFDRTHITSEVYYSGGWHQFDCNLKGFAMDPTTDRVSTIVELSQHTNWVDSAVARGYNVYPYPSDRSLVKSSVPDPNPDHYEFRRFTLGHTMDYILRMGEELTCYWRADSTRYLNDPSWWGSGDWAWVGNRIIQNREKMWEHDKNVTALGSGHHYKRHGMVHFKYSPDLKSGSTDYTDGYWDHSNVALAAAGLQSQQTNAYTVFEVKTPWPIIGKNGSDQAALTALTGMTAGATVNFTVSGATPVRVYIAWKYPDAAAVTWGSAAYTANTAGAHSFDFTTRVYGTYGYLIKFEFAQAGGVLENFTLDTWGQVWPGSLPMPLHTQTKMTYTHKDVKGFPTVPGYVFYDTVPASPIHIKPPRNCPIKWFSAGACFSMFSTGGRIEYSTNGTNYTTLWQKSSIGDNFDASHWVLQFDTSFVFTTPVNELWIRMSEPSPVGYGFRGARVYWHYQESDRPVTNNPVQVTYFNGNPLGLSPQLVAQTTVENNQDTFFVDGNPPSMVCPYSLSLKVASSTVQVEEAKQSIAATPLLMIVEPNPFNPKTRIAISGQTAGSKNATISIYNARGNLIEKLSAASGQLSAGIIWDASSQPSGMYIVLVKCNGQILTKRVTLLK